MSKRKISHQQSVRMEKKQQHLRENIITDSSNIDAEGLIITRFGRHVLLETSEKKHIHCSIRPALHSLVAGDRVLWRAEKNGQGVVVSLYPRQTVLGRPDKQGQLKPVAANITQLIIVVAPKPIISWPLLDSYLVIAEFLRLQAIIVLNKTDLESQVIQDQLRSQYGALGYPVLFTHFHDKKGYLALQSILNHQVSVFVGQSGVGKSSIITQLLPDEINIQTAEISTHTDLGCHTTTNSYFYPIPTGGALIDSPGVREFGLWHMPQKDIANGYREFRPYLTQCKFRNCDHQQSPGCALIAAIKRGEITPTRHDNYVRLSKQYAK